MTDHTLIPQIVKLPHGLCAVYLTRALADMHSAHERPDDDILDDPAEESFGQWVTDHA